MATIIDALLVTAGFDPKRFAADTITGAAGLGQMAENLGMSTERLSAWQKAAERAGATAAAISAQLKESSGEVANFNRGAATESIPGFFRHGGNVGDLKDGNTYLLARSRIIADLYQKDRTQAALAAQEMGISDSLFDLFKRGPVELEKQLRVQERRAPLSKDDAQAALLLRDRYLDLRDTFEAVSVKVLLALMPVFERLVSVAQGLGDYLLENREEVVAWVDGVVQAIVGFIDVADAAAQAVGGWQNVLLALGALKILSWASRLLDLAAALKAVATALGSLGGAGGTAGLGALREVGPAALAAAARAAGGLALLLASKDVNVGEAEFLAARDNPALRSKEVVAAVKFFQSKGYIKPEAAGLAANLQAQSNLNPRAERDNGNAYGIGLWNPVRQADFKRMFGKDIRESTLQEQLDFVDRELKETMPTVRKKLAEIGTPIQAGEVVYRHVVLSQNERADDSEARKRAAAAQVVFWEVYGDGAERGLVTAASVASAAQISAVDAPSNSTTTSHSSETHIHGPVTVVTQATDGEGVARVLAGVGRSQNLVQQGNTGMF